VPSECANDPTEGVDCMMSASTGYGYWYNEFSNGPLSGVGTTENGADGNYLRCNYGSDGTPDSLGCLVYNPATNGEWNHGADMNVELDGTFVTNSVPEPASIAFFGIGLAGIGLLRRRQR